MGFGPGAHQLTEQAWGILDDTPHHVAAFLKACHLLRANPKASGAYPLLRDRILRKQTDGNDRLLSRVQKLLALAQKKIIFKANPHSVFILFPSDFLEQYGLRFRE
ncbi:MAG: hypothetical protein JRK26_05755 [Deltaproteobacteria bacterium]|nr:hypothetical protein [Deltaproteobacteria bacterium]